MRIYVLRVKEKWPRPGYVIYTEFLRNQTADLLPEVASTGFLSALHNTGHFS